MKQKTREYLEQLKADSNKYGSYIWDVDNVDRYETNIGVIKDENGKLVPIVIDLDSVSDRNNFLKMGRATFQKPDFQYTLTLTPTDTDYLAAQKAHVERLGLEYGSLKGVWDGEAVQKELEDFAEERGKLKTEYTGEECNPEHPLWVNVVKNGISRSEFGYEANKAQPSGKGFCHDIRARLEEKGAIPQR